MNTNLIKAVGCAAVLFLGLCQASGRAIYPEPNQAEADLAAALQTASAEHRRVIVDFGGNWCPDCLALDVYFHDDANKSMLEANFVLVHVNVGRLDRNLNIAQRFQIPLNKGVPALAVLDSNGLLIYSQHTGEFEAMRKMQPSAVTQFLQRWKPPAG